MKGSSKQAVKKILKFTWHQMSVPLLHVSCAIFAFHDSRTGSD